MFFSFARISTMGSRGTNSSLQTAPLFPTASSGEEAPLQNAISSAGENVLPPTSRQASPASLQPAGPAFAGVSPELVALISQTVQAALAAERVSSSAAAIATSLSSSTAVNPSSDKLPCSVGVPDSLSSLASSAASLLAAGTGFGVQSVQGRPSHSLVVPSLVSTFALPSMSSFASSASATNVCSLQSGAIRDIAAPPPHPEPLGSSSSGVVCISWNKGRCTAPFASCRYAHRCEVCSGFHRATACSSRPSRDSCDDRKRRDSFPGSSSGAKARRT